jgi:gamma-glutamylcyclotransferase
MKPFTILALFTPLATSFTQIKMGSPSSSNNTTIYFGYGSNLWLHQMHIRCPTSKYLGVARLNKFKWIINDRGYANVVEVKNDKNTKAEEKSGKSKFSEVVFGLVYSLEPADEARLDKNEGVPIAYTKENLSCDFWSAGLASDPESPNHGKVDTSTPPTLNRNMLVYIDRQRITPDEPRKEYIFRMNQGIEDAVKLGVPQDYVDEVMREYIPAEKEDEASEVEEFAKKQATQFEDESGVFGTEGRE